MTVLDEEIDNSIPRDKSLSGLDFNDIPGSKNLVSGYEGIVEREWESNPNLKVGKRVHWENSLEKIIKIRNMCLDKVPIIRDSSGSLVGKTGGE
ncbi:hypothetical protein Tco_0738171 [Tanacetum coccineum]